MQACVGCRGIIIQIIFGGPMEDELLQTWLDMASTEEIKARLVDLYEQLLFMDNHYKVAVGKAWGILP